MDSSGISKYICLIAITSLSNSSSGFKFRHLSTFISPSQLGSLLTHLLNNNFGSLRSYRIWCSKLGVGSYNYFRPSNRRISCRTSHLKVGLGYFTCQQRTLLRDPFKLKGRVVSRALYNNTAKIPFSVLVSLLHAYHCDWQILGVFKIWRTSRDWKAVLWSCIPLSSQLSRVGVQPPFHFISRTSLLPCSIPSTVAGDSWSTQDKPDQYCSVMSLHALPYYKDVECLTWFPYDVGLFSVSAERYCWCFCDWSLCICHVCFLVFESQARQQ